MIRIALLIPSFVLVLLLTGCAAAVVGGAAAGGYYVAKSDRTAAEIASDTAITSTINSRYVKDDLVSAFDVNVDTHRGTVTLYGNVPSQQAAQRAVELARTVKGVNRVQSKLTVVSR
ncbi:MAG: BON domain-containing protein [Gammaproteobacteria bacterium]|jgi:hyperosmotically inducible protein|nr:MAG: BON domain-containing protein [Gammaproteobacteria bacterium]